MARRPVLALSSLAIFVAALIALVWFGQRSVMYFPSSQVPSPGEVGLPLAEQVTFQTDDRLELDGWFVRSAALPPSGYTVIVFNGNAGHRGYRARLAASLAANGMAVLLFDYRGYGGNPGLPHEQGLLRDARGALAYVRQRPDVDPHRIVFFGESLGTGIAVALAVEHAPAALVLRSPFTSFMSMARHHFPLLPVTWLLRDRYDSASAIGRVRSPILIIAGDRDSVVPFEDSEALFEYAPEPKRFVVIHDADHNDEALTEGSQVIQAVTGLLGLGQ